jgi:hypothetical protein
MADIQLSIPERFQAALAALLTSFDYAQDSGLDAWQFAIDLPELLANGATLADLRWLIHRGFAEHSKETTIAGEPARSFRSLARTNFPDDACVVLTSAGATAIRSLLADTTAILPSQSAANGVAARIRGSKGHDSGDRGSRRSARGVGFQPASSTIGTTRGVGFEPASSSVANAHGAAIQPAASPDPPLRKGGQGWACGHVITLTSAAPLVPHYDAMLHELRLGDEIVKCFTRPATAQELILAVLEEEGWPPAIDDPLTSPNQDPKRHLHYTVRNLNRGQDPLRIRFYINGHGETIRWEIVPLQRAPSARQARKRR